MLRCCLPESRPPLSIPAFATTRSSPLRQRLLLACPMALRCYVAPPLLDCARIRGPRSCPGFAHTCSGLRRIRCWVFCLAR